MGAWPNDRTGHPGGRGRGNRFCATPWRSPVTSAPTVTPWARCSDFGIAAENAGKKVVASFGTPFDVSASLAFLPTRLLVPPQEFPADPPMMVVFDAGSLDRLGELAENASQAATTIVIDHHITNEGFGDIAVVDGQAAATGELVAHLLEILGWPLTPEIATCLHTALVTDTGRFQYANTRPSTLMLAAGLVAAGADPPEISRHVYEEAPFGYLKVAGAALGRAELDEDKGVVSAVVTQADLVEAGIDWGDIDNLINTVRLAVEADVRGAGQGPCRRQGQAQPALERGDRCRIARRGDGRGRPPIGGGDHLRRERGGCPRRGPAKSRGLQVTKGFLVVDKPGGITSNAVVGRVRKVTGIKKVGHAGTLDPMATGAMVVAIGPVTRLIRFIQEQPKEYLATAQFGVATDTLDADGAVLEREPMEFSEAELKEAAERFVGPILQIPPMVSALKHQGRRLYELARQGEVVEREARPVEVYELEILSVGPGPYPDVEFRVVCGKGTYVRSLAADMAAVLGGTAHLTALRRTRIGSLEVDVVGVALDDLEGWEESMLTPSQALSDLPAVTVSDGTAEGVSNGVRFLGGELVDAPDGSVRVLDNEGELLAIYRSSGAQAFPEVVLAS